MGLDITRLSLVVGGLSAIWWLNAYLRERKANPRRLPLPPGLKGYPIIGSLFEMPTYLPWLVYDRWFKTYGDMIYFKVLGQGFLILGSIDRTNDIFEKRSSNYADRPRMPMLLEIMEWGYAMTFLPYGSWWRRHRRTFHDHFHPNIVHKHQPIQVSATRAFLRNLLKEPEEFMDLVRLSFATTIMKAVYGITVKDQKDPYVTEAEIALHGLAEAGTPGKFLVDMIPLMLYIPSWFPGAGWKRQGERWGEVNRQVAHRPFELVKQKMKEGTASACVATTLIEDLPDEDSPERADSETIARHVCAVAYAGGADTTVSAVQSFILAMCKYPEAQKKAQAELDRVLNGRLPEFSDRPYLPYINAMVKETMRWLPVTPLAFYHMASEDDEYDGYHIPKGTLVIGNTWTILHDPEEFERPLDYYPDHYMKDGQFNPAVRDPNISGAFGWGRRICAGRFLSDNSLFLTIAHVLSVYDIKPGLDENGKEVEVSTEVTSGVLSYPLPFKCRITPRSKAAEQLIHNSELME